MYRYLLTVRLWNYELLYVPTGVQEVGVKPEPSDVFFYVLPEKLK